VAASVARKKLENIGSRIVIEMLKIHIWQRMSALLRVSGPIHDGMIGFSLCIMRDRAGEFVPVEIMSV
jgi:hypothetical protein